MKKTFCDKCGKEIVRTPELVTLEQWNNADNGEYESTEYELCDICFRSVESVLISTCNHNR